MQCYAPQGCQGFFTGQRESDGEHQCSTDWHGFIYEIITYAAKMFVIYYALQALQAALAARRRGQSWHALFFAAVGMALLMILFAKPLAA
jgi:hypothetical protein